MGISEKIGYLQIGGKPITNEQLAVMAGVPVDQVIPLINELEINGVFSRDGNGIPYCRRMAREGIDYLKAKEYGKLGGNPALKEEDKNQKLEAKGGLTPTLNHTLNPMFEQFWTAYPRKIGKKSALKAFNKATDMPDIKVVINTIEAQKQSKQWQAERGKFIPHPATWLNQGRWDDVMEVKQEHRSMI